MQSFISIILLIIFSLDLSLSDIPSKLICIGSIYALIRANSYIQHLFGGISTDISNNLNFMKSILFSATFFPFHASNKCKTQKDVLIQLF